MVQKFVVDVIVVKNIIKNKCDNCFKREGNLVFRGLMPAQPWLHPPITEPWIFKYYLCRWCRSAENKRRAITGHYKKLVVIQDEDHCS